MVPTVEVDAPDVAEEMVRNEMQAKYGDTAIYTAGHRVYTTSTLPRERRPLDCARGTASNTTPLAGAGATAKVEIA